MAQDSVGFLWLGTNNGLNRFDGYSIKVYKNDFLDSNSLQGNRIECLLPAGKGIMWVGTNNGLSKFNNRTGKTSNYLAGKFIRTIFLNRNNNLYVGTRNGTYKISEYDKPERLTGNELFDEVQINSITQTGDTLWLGSYNRGLFCYAENKIIHPDILPEEVERIIKLESFNNYLVIFTAYNGTYIYNTSTGDLFRKEMYFNSSPEIKADYFISAGKHKRGILVNSRREIYLLDFYARKIIDLTPDNVEISMRTMLLDKTNNLWVGTNGYGLYRFPAQDKKFFTLKAGRKEISVTSIRAIFTDEDSNLWIGGKGGLDIVYNYENHEQRVCKPVSRLGNCTVYSILPSVIKTDLYWIATEGKGVFKFNSKTGSVTSFRIPSRSKITEDILNRVYSSIRLSNGKIVFGTNKGLLIYSEHSGDCRLLRLPESNSESTPPDEIKSLLEDSKGRLWVGSSRNGLYKIDTSNYSAINYKSGKNGLGSISSNGINSIYQSTSGTIWIATQNGLNKYSENDSSFIYVDLRGKIPDDCIYSILEDQKNILWLSTNRGLVEYSVSSGDVRVFDETYGLQSNEFNTGAYFKDKTGLLFFGGIKGVTWFSSDQITTSSFQANVIFKDFKINNKEAPQSQSVTFKSSIVLDYSTSTFSFEFISDDLTSPSRTEYRYMLDEPDNKWIYTKSNNRIISFNKLSPGNYKLLANCTNADGVWSKNIRSMNIIVTPPFWSTWWFKSAAFLLIIFLLYIYTKTKIERSEKEKRLQQEFSKKLIEREEQEKEKIAGELHDELGQELLVTKNKLLIALTKEDKEKHVKEAIDLLTKSANSISDISHFLRPGELTDFGLTLSVESMLDKLSEVTNINFELNLGDLDKYFTSDEAINVYRIFQEATNNIIKHSGADKVRILSSIEKEVLSIIIEDNGCGFNPENVNNKNGTHFGLSGIKERIRILKGSLEIESGKGTRMILSFNRRAQ